MPYMIEALSDAGRITAHGRIDDLSKGFHLDGNKPFSIYLRPKSASSKMDAVINLQCEHDTAPSEVPVPLYAWSELRIVDIPAGQTLSDFDVYWGAGIAAEPAND